MIVAGNTSPTRHSICESSYSLKRQISDLEKIMDSAHVHEKVLRIKTKDIVCNCSHSGKSEWRDDPLSRAWKV